MSETAGTVVTARPETPLPGLVDEMVRYGISSVPIVDSDDRLVG
jgi:CBS domain-containing protein